MATHSGSTLRSCLIALMMVFEVPEQDGKIAPTSPPERAQCHLRHFALFCLTNPRRQITNCYAG